MLEKLYQELGGHKLDENKYMLHCPAHNDSNPSLLVTKKGSEILPHCFAGCSNDAVYNALIIKGINIRNQRSGDDRNNVSRQKKSGNQHLECV